MLLSQQTIAFLTQHGKDDLLRSLFYDKTGCALVRATGYDTDQLGTFTRDIPRPGSQLAAARVKAHKAIELTGIPVGLGSEGTFGADPVGGLIPWNTEILVWFDTTTKLEVIGAAQGPGSGLHKVVDSERSLLSFVKEAGFPDHGLVLRPVDSPDNIIFKDLRELSVLLESFRSAQSASASGRVHAEVDLRAHMNPTRQQMILRAAENLINKLLSACPICRSPGFWEKERISGLPCATCSRPTRLPIATIWRCDACEHSESRANSVHALADPGRCDHCNP